MRCIVGKTFNKTLVLGNPCVKILQLQNTTIRSTSSGTNEAPSDENQ